MRLPENYIRHIWKNLYLRLNDLQTERGEKLDVVSVGDLNANEGADFLNARIRLNGKELAGDIEIHSRASDWTRHNHAGNPRYDRVILHVVFERDAESDFAIPTLELRRFLNDELYKVIAACIRDDAALSQRRRLHCSPTADAIDDALKINWIQELAQARFEQKARRFETMLVGDDYDGAIYRGVMRALGYSENTAPMERLATIVGYDKLRQFGERSFVERRSLLEAAFFSMSGLLDSETEADEDAKQYVQSLRARVEGCSFGDGQPLRREDWNFFRLRPSNFPTARLAGLAEMLSKNLERGFVGNALDIVNMSLSPRRKLAALENLFVADAYGYWQTHYRFGASAKKPLNQLVGKTRAAEIVINTLLPALWLLAKKTNDDVLSKKIASLYDAYPKGLTSETSIETARELLGDGYKIKSAAFEQGLLELKKNYCDKFRCLECAIGKRILA